MAKPKAKAKKKPAKKSKPKPVTKKKRGAPNKRTPRSVVSVVAGEALGEVVAPSGKLAIFDIGLMGFLPRDALEPALIVVDVPATGLPVIGTRVGSGRFADCWDSVIVPLGGGESTHNKKLGEAGVDFARLMLVDHAALDHWRHEDSLDGRADFVFWGRDAAALASKMRAPMIKDGYGWTDLTVDEADKKADLAARYKAENKWLLATDLRPHSHHFHILAAARASATGAGTLELAGSRAVLFFTSWGDGVFPVYLDLDADDCPTRIRIQLAPVATDRA